VRAKPAAKAAIDFVAFTARLEAAPFQNRALQSGVAKIFCDLREDDYF
jgi:hypothetical protein